MSRVDAAGSNDGLSLPVGALLRQAEETPDGTVLVTRHMRNAAEAALARLRLSAVAIPLNAWSASPGFDDATGFLISDGYSGYRRLLPLLAGVQ